MALSRTALARVPLGAVAAFALGCSAVAADTRILAVGDSITEGHAGGQCGYRRALGELLAAPGCEATFVGSRFGDASRDPRCAATSAPHFGLSGLRADFFVAGDPSPLEREVAERAPDRVLLTLGTNDVFGGQTIESTAAEIDLAVGQVLGRAPGASVYVANAVPVDDARAGTSGVASRMRRLGEAVGELVERRRAGGERVRLVDLSTGFDAATMTTDGVHPNDVGERLIAERFSRALAADGVCAPFDAPAKRLASGRWYQIGVPGRPGGFAPGTVAEVFGDDLPLSGYGNAAPSPTWALFGLVGEGGETRYEALAPSSPLVPGRAYWIVQATGREVSVDLPAAALPTPLAPEPGCAGPSGCLAVPLTDPPPERSGWTLAANPFPRRVDFGATRTRTAGGACDPACTPAEAADASVMTRRAYRWDGGPGYATLGAGESLGPWEGVWLETLGAARGRSPAWLVPVD